jgi:putative N-acetylmannosamine-6-phosphate epimerase
MPALRTALLNHLTGQLVVSCQAAAGSPLEETSHIVALARAAVIGGGRGVRIESVANVTAVRLAVDAPIIGIVKARHPDTDVFITATSAEVAALATAGADIIAFDATRRPRPEPVTQLNSAVHARGRIAMADISTLDEAKAAIADGADFVSNALRLYFLFPLRCRPRFQPVASVWPKRSALRSGREDWDSRGSAAGAGARGQFCGCGIGDHPPRCHHPPFRRRDRRVGSMHASAGGFEWARDIKLHCVRSP